MNDLEHECERCACGHDDCRHTNNAAGDEWCIADKCKCSGFRLLDHD